MAGDGLSADQERLRHMGSQLSGSTDWLGGAAEAAPPPPAVTTSSERVGHTLAEIMTAAGALITGVEDTASKINASNGAYAETDNQSVEELYQVPKFSR